MGPGDRARWKGGKNFLESIEDQYLRVIILPKSTWAKIAEPKEQSKKGKGD